MERFHLRSELEKGGTAASSYTYQEPNFGVKDSKTLWHIYTNSLNITLHRKVIKIVNFCGIRELQFQKKN